MRQTYLENAKKNENLIPRPKLRLGTPPPLQKWFSPLEKGSKRGFGDARGIYG